MLSLVIVLCFDPLIRLCASLQLHRLLLLMLQLVLLVLMCECRQEWRDTPLSSVLSLSM